MIKELFPDEPHVNVCVGCDAEFTVDLISEDQMDVIVCPFCGTDLYDDDDGDNDEDFDEMDEL